MLLKRHEPRLSRPVAGRWGGGTQRRGGQSVL